MKDLLVLMLIFGVGLVVMYTVGVIKGYFSFPFKRRVTDQELIYHSTMQKEEFEDWLEDQDSPDGER